MRDSLPDVAVILENENYWSHKTFLAFKELCNELAFDDPHACLLLARRAPDLASVVAPRFEKPDLVYVDGYALLGSAYQLTARFRDADQAFAKALEHAVDLSPLESAELKLRMAYLRRDQKRFEEALALVGAALQSYRREGDLTAPAFLGHCYVVRGTIQYAHGSLDLSVVDLSTALNHLDVKESPRIFHAAIHNLAIALVGCNQPGALDKAMTLLRKARRNIRIRGRHVAKYKFKWLEGMICIRFGSTRQGERLLYAAREGLAEVEAVHEVALISLDIESLYVLECRPAWEIEALAQETFKIFSSINSDEEALGVLRMWLEAAAREMVTDEILLEVRAKLAQLTKPAM